MGIQTMRVRAKKPSPRGKVGSHERSAVGGRGSVSNLERFVSYKLHTKLTKWRFPELNSRPLPLVTLRYGSPFVSLRLGHTRVLTCHRHVIHCARAASLRRSLQFANFLVRSWATSAFLLFILSVRRVPRQSRSRTARDRGLRNSY